MDIVRGALDKPISTKRLINTLGEMSIEKGILFTGYPIIGALDNQYSLDALMITQNHGIILFDIVEHDIVEDRSAIRDSLYNAVISKLIHVKGLSERRGTLGFPLTVFTYAPVWNKVKDLNDDEVIISKEEFENKLQKIQSPIDLNKYSRIIEAIQSITKLKQRPPRQVTNEKSKGAILNLVEQSISNLDRFQSKAVIETSLGVQRIRGLAGSGKTVILALKAAYLHAKYPEWNIGITFYTRALKDQFKDLVTKFTIEQKNESPDWEKIKIMQAWGSPKVEGIYYYFCKINDIEYHDYDSAKSKYTNEKDLLGKISEEALRNVNNPIPFFDVILIDEAQDFSESFLRICYFLLKSSDINNSANRRLVYAYDELQKLNELTLREPKEIFGQNIDFENDDSKPNQDVILKVCYRNSANVLVTAHGLGFGIYRKDKEGNTRLVTMFENKELWKGVGYDVVGGSLEFGQYVELARNDDTSPELISSHVPKSEILNFKQFANREEQNNWIASEIEKNLREDELNYKDIIVIHPYAYTTKSETAALREILIKKKINSHLAGVNTSQDEFFIDGSIAFTSIFRAKGNEAAMIYIMNTNYCFGGDDLINKRNTLFTAITRSKGWVRACGVGPDMASLITEFDLIKQNEFQLKFKYPTLEEMKHLNIIHRYLSVDEKKKIATGSEEAQSLLNKLLNKEIMPEDLPEHIRMQLINILYDNR